MTERTSYATGIPSWVDLSTPDLEGALAFYGGLFGWELQDAGEEAGHYHQAHLRGKRVAGIGPAQPGGPPMAFWTIYLAGDDADAHAEAVRAAGGAVIVGPMDIFDQGRMLVAAEPDGAMFGVWEPRAHHGSELVNEDGAPTWNELYTRDLAASTRFYGAVFGHAVRARCRSCRTATGWSRSAATSSPGWCRSPTRSRRPRRRRTGSRTSSSRTSTPASPACASSAASC